MPDRALCRHCHYFVAQKGRRGLCYGCYLKTAVLVLYPITSKYGLRSPITDSHAPRPWPEPTASAPGTPDKVAVLAARALAGERLFHPHDAT